MNHCGSAEASGFPQVHSIGGSWSLDSLSATLRFGRRLPDVVQQGAILLLQGPLGAGKTSLVQGLAEALGIGEPITSPTFNLAQHYPDGNPPLVHLDLYRLENPAADELFLQEEEEARALGALMAVEWPERLSLELPAAWRLDLQHQGDGRLVRLTPPMV